MKSRFIIPALSAIILATGCSSKFGPNDGLLGGYSDKKIDEYIFYVEYEGTVLDSSDTVLKHLHKRASELCESSDYLHDARALNHGMGYKAKGVVYCNSGFLDSRLQLPDKNFEHFLTISKREFAHKELTPLYTLLSKNKFNQLNIEVKTILDQHSNHSLNERGLKNLFNTFSRSDKNLENNLSKWIQHSPDNAMPHYSRAIYYYAQAWRERGFDTWDNLTAGQKIRFKRYNKLARQDATKSRSLEPDLSIIHALLINIANSYSEAKQSYEIAMTHTPHSYLVKKAYFRMLLPRWGVSTEKMQEFVNSNKKYIAQNPELKKLELLLKTEEADQLLFNKKPKKAFELYTDVLSKGVVESALLQRAFLLIHQKRFQEAIDSFTTVLKISPYSISAAEGLMQTHIKLNNLAEALKLSNFLIAMDASSSNYLLLRANIYYAVRRYHDALQDFKKAAAMSPDTLIIKHKIRLTEYQIQVRSADNSRIKQTPGSI